MAPYSLTPAVLCLAAMVSCSSDRTGPDPQNTVAAVIISGVPAGPAVIGDSIQLAATAVNAANLTISSAIFTWQTSDALLASVSTTGFVRVLGAGSVTISATAGGKTGTALLELQARCGLATVDHVMLSGAALGGALYTGQTGHLTATLFDAANSPLAGGVIAWSSSDPTRATVSNGTITGVARGTASITARCEGKFASTEVTVLTRPTADWSQANAEWATYQGNADHTGFVDATLDPLIFVERWVRTVVGPEIHLNPVTTGPEAAFVSTAYHFSSEWVTALDLSTGAPKWSKDFGSVYAVNPPAYNNGTVYLTTVGLPYPYLWAFDASTGALRFQSLYMNQFSEYYAPVVVGQQLFMAGGLYDGMYSFDALTGVQLWFASTEQYAEWTPAVRNGIVYAYRGFNPPKLIAVNASTGATVFEIPDPTLGGSSRNFTSLTPTLGQFNDLLVMVMGRLESFDLTSRHLRWSRSAEFFGSITTAANVVYVIEYVDHNSQIDAVNESDGSLLWTWKPPEGQLEGNGVVTRNLLFVATATATYAIDLSSHRQVWSYPAGGHLSLSPQGVLFIARADGQLSAISVR